MKFIVFAATVLMPRVSASGENVTSTSFVLSPGRATVPIGEPALSNACMSAVLHGCSHTSDVARSNAAAHKLPSPDGKLTVCVSSTGAGPSGSTSTGVSATAVSRERSARPATA